MDEKLFIGWDLSTTQLKGVVITADLQCRAQASVDFDEDFGIKYGIERGVLANASTGAVFSPNAMWLEAIDLVMERLTLHGLDMSKIAAMSGAAMQHGTVFWSDTAEDLLQRLTGKKTLSEQLDGVFSHPLSPNWQDASTSTQCEQFDSCLGSPEGLAAVTGSKAHHRFSGPQILKFRQSHPDAYRKTSRISLVSSFLASIFLGKIAPMDRSDVGGMNLRSITTDTWDAKLMDLVGGDPEGARQLECKLGPVHGDAGETLGAISHYFVERYGFAADCQIIPFTGDNPSTMLSLPLRVSDVIVSLGTSTTFLMSTPEYKPDPMYHYMHHPTTSDLYMFMLCFKNGSLARERVRDAVNEIDVSNGQNATPAKSWDTFNEVALQTPPLGQHLRSDPAIMGLFFPRPEIVPPIPAGIWLYQYDSPNSKLSLAAQAMPYPPAANGVVTNGTRNLLHQKSTVRAVLESQFLSCRLRATPVISTQDGKQSRSAQPRRIYIAGGGSVNPAIVQVLGEVLGGTEGVYRLEIGGNACALGSAYKAVWALERSEGEKFETLIGKRWNEEAFARKVDVGYRQGVWENYGEVISGFAEMESTVLCQTTKAMQTSDK